MQLHNANILILELQRVANVKSTQLAKSVELVTYTIRYNTLALSPSAYNALLYYNTSPCILGPPILISRECMSKYQMSLLQPSDLHALYKFEKNNRVWFESQIQSRGPEFYSVVGVKLHIDECLAMYRNNAMFPVLVKSQIGDIVARVNLHSIDVDKRRALLGYRVAEKYVGEGIASFAAKSIITSAKDKFGIKTFVAIASKHNLASQRVLEKVGFNRVRSYPNYAEVSGNALDCYEYVLDLE